MLRNATRFAAVLLCTLVVACNRSASDTETTSRFTKTLKIWIHDTQATPPSYVFQACDKWAAKAVGCLQSPSEDDADIRVYAISRPGGNNCPEPKTVYVSTWKGNTLEVKIKKVPSAKYQVRDDGTIFVFAGCDRENAGFPMEAVTLEQVLDGQIALKAKVVGS